MASSSLNLQSPDVASTVSSATEGATSLRLRQGLRVRASSAERTQRHKPADSHFEITKLRNASPIPAERLSRKRSNLQKTGASTERSTDGVTQPSFGVTKMDKSFDLRGGRILSGNPDNTWSLSSLASTLLGSSLTPKTKSAIGTGVSTSNRRRQRHDTQMSNNSHVKPQSVVGASDWGPNPGSGTSTLSQSIQDTTRRYKREALLSKFDDEQMDASGQYKRKTSEESERHPQLAGDILVYMHDVKATDTFAGIMLMYNISAHALQKANRLWPNDSIQTRSKLFLPVEECMMKGKLVNIEDHPLSTRQPDASIDSLSVSEATNQVPNLPTELVGMIDVASLSRHIESSKPRNTSTATHPFQNIDKITWDHHSYVQIEPLGIVEVVRLPRPQLSYFPPPQHRPVTSLPVMQAAQGDEPGLGQMIGELAKESLDGLEIVGNAIENFLRKVTVKAGVLVPSVNNDLIELTQGLRSDVTTRPGWLAGEVDPVALAMQEQSHPRTSGMVSQIEVPSKQQILTKPRSRRGTSSQQYNQDGALDELRYGETTKHTS